MKFNRYLRPETLDEALALWKENGEDGRLVAGGTDLVIRLKDRTLRVDTNVDLEAIDELKQITFNGNELEIGACCKLRDISLNKELLDSEWAIVAECAGCVSSTQIRNS
ncbi:MAG TPA: hypothetical protein GX717_08705, partial [Clostridiaceae bacterium]|nr:hypothetical protein [Clostridiaceae bacterium]